MERWDFDFGHFTINREDAQDGSSRWFLKMVPQDGSGTIAKKWEMGKIKMQGALPHINHESGAFQNMTQEVIATRPLLVP